MPVAKHPTEVKEAWLEKWLFPPEKAEKVTLNQIRAAMAAEFGEVLRTPRLRAVVSDLRRRAELARREANGEDTRPGVQVEEVSSGAPLQQTISGLRLIMQAAGIEAIRLLPDGQVDVKLKVTS